MGTYSCLDLVYFILSNSSHEIWLFQHRDRVSNGSYHLVYRGIIVGKTFSTLNNAH